MNNSLCGKRGKLATKQPRPLVLSSSKYKQILSVCNSGERAKKEAEEIQRHREYLEKCSNDLVATWSTEGCMPTQEQRQAEKKHQIMARIEHDALETKKIKEKDEQKRIEKITNARELISKLKPGPKELQSALMTSEALKGRLIQQTIKKNYDDSFEKLTAEEQFKLECQSMPWIEEEQKRICNTLKKNREHQAELLKAIQEKARKKADQRNWKLAEGKYLIDICETETKAQTIKQQEVVKCKQDLVRKSTLQAMTKAEQRNARERIQDKIEEKVIDAYNDGRSRIKAIIKERAAQSHQEKMARIEENGRKLMAILDDSSNAEEARYQRDVNRLELQYTAQEKEKAERAKQMKLERVQIFSDDVEARKEKELQTMEETRLDMANRFKNEEINAAYSQKLEKDRLNNIDQVRNDLSIQIEERRKIDAGRRAYEQDPFATSYEKDDKFFFDFADNLVKSAVKMERPLFPFVKAIRNYKKANNLDADYPLPANLVDNIHIGMKIPECVPNPGDMNRRKNGLDEIICSNPYILCV